MVVFHLSHRRGVFSPAGFSSGFAGVIWCLGFRDFPSGSVSVSVSNLISQRRQDRQEMTVSFPIFTSKVIGWRMTAKLIAFGLNNISPAITQAAETLSVKSSPKK